MWLFELDIKMEKDNLGFYVEGYDKYEPIAFLAGISKNLRRPNMFQYYRCFDLEGLFWYIESIPEKILSKPIFYTGTITIKDERAIKEYRKTLLDKLKWIVGGWMKMKKIQKTSIEKILNKGDLKWQNYT